MNKKKLLTFCFLFIIVSSFIFTTKSIAAVPQMIHLQAYLVDEDDQPLSGIITLTVRFYYTETGGTPVFVNDPADRYVNVNDGVINYYIKRFYGIDFSREI
jgi:hypothetical protein